MRILYDVEILEVTGEGVLLRSVIVVSVLLCYVLRYFVSF